VKVLVINCGSSSLKYELFETVSEQSLAHGIAERVVVGGGREASLRHYVAGRQPVVMKGEMPDHEVAVGYVLSALTFPPSLTPSMVSSATWAKSPPSATESCMVESASPSRC